MPIFIQPDNRLRRADVWYGLKWFFPFLAAFAAVFILFRWIDQGDNFTITWTVATHAEEYANLSYTWTLAAVGSLLIVSARKGSYLLVLGLCSIAFYIRCEPVFAFYFLISTMVLYPILHYVGKWRSWIFWPVLITLTLFIPKWIYYEFYHHPNQWSWLSDVGLTGLFIRYAYYWYELRRGLWQKPGFFEHLSYLAFIPQITGVLNFSPSSQWSNPGDFPKVYIRGWKILGLAAFKLFVFKLMCLGESLVNFDLWATDNSIPMIWFGAIFLYIKWFLWLSCHYDLSVALCRFLGADLPNNFNLPLLAPSFIEQWRRWNIFNRKLLIKFFYFPFGGKEKHRFRNVFIVFLASAVFLHSGWFATKWPTVNGEYLLSWILFAISQATFVCLNMKMRDERGLEGHFWPRGWAYFRGLLFTQVSLAWLRILILGTGSMPGDTVVPLTQRIETMLRAFGISI